MPGAIGQEPPQPAAPAVAAAALLAWLLACAYSLAPFETGGPLDEPLSSIALAERLTPNFLVSLVQHFLAFVALGVLDRTSAGRLSGTQRANWLRPLALARGLLLCAGIEIAQLFLPARHAEVVDVGVNAAGLIAGHVLGGRILSSGFAEGLRNSQRRYLRAAALAAWVGFWSAVLLLPAWLSALDTWDPSYPLVIGNELTGDRPWLGEVRYVAFYDRALTADEAGWFAGLGPGSPAGADARVDSGLIAGFDFTRADRTPVEPTGRATDPSVAVVLPPGVEWSRGDPAALALDAGVSLIRSTGPAASLTGPIAASGRFSLETWIRPANTVQDGPARIVSVSASPYRRNVTLGQEGKAIHFRVRNRLNGVNGTDHALTCDALSQRWLHVVATYDRGLSNIFVDGRSPCRAVDLREPSVTLGLGTGAVGHVVTALMLVLSLVVASCGGASLHQLLLRGYALLLAAWAVSALLGIPVAWSLHLWLLPAIVISWVALVRRRPLARSVRAV